MTHPTAQALNMTFTDGEVGSLIEATVDSIYKRLQWSIRPDSNWRDLELGYAQQMLRNLERSYSKLYLTYRSLGTLHDAFVDAFTFSDEVYELIDDILDASSWEEIEAHDHEPITCKVCREVQRIPE